MKFSFEEAYEYAIKNKKSLSHLTCFKYAMGESDDEFKDLPYMTPGRRRKLLKSRNPLLKSATTRLCDIYTAKNYRNRRRSRTRNCNNRSRTCN